VGAIRQHSTHITLTNPHLYWRILLVHRAFFALAAVFLAVAIVVPVALLLTQAESDLDNYIITQNPTGMRTQTNASLPTAEELQQSHADTLIIVLVVEVVFVLLFMTALYYGLKTHPLPKKVE